KRAALQGPFLHQRRDRIPEQLVVDPVQNDRQSCSQNQQLLISVPASVVNQMADIYRLHRFLSARGLLKFTYCGSLSQIQQRGTISVAKAAMSATAVNPPESKAAAEIVATVAMPTWDAALRKAMYSPRIPVPTISVVSAWSGACRAE